MNEKCVKRIENVSNAMSWSKDLDYELFLAARDGDAVKVERLIAEKANVNYDVCFCPLLARVVFFVR